MKAKDLIKLLLDIGIEKEVVIAGDCMRVEIRPCDIKEEENKILIRSL